MLSEEAMAKHRAEEEAVRYELKLSKLRHAIKRERSMVKRWELEKDLELKREKIAEIRSRHEYKLSDSYINIPPPE